MFNYYNLLCSELQKSKCDKKKSKSILQPKSRYQFKHLNFMKIKWWNIPNKSLYFESSTKWEQSPNFKLIDSWAQLEHFHFSTTRYPLNKLSTRYIRQVSHMPKSDQKHLTAKLTPSISLSIIQLNTDCTL